MKKIYISSISARRINDIINAVNAGVGASEIYPLLDIYNDTVDEMVADWKKRGKVK